MNWVKSVVVLAMSILPLSTVACESEIVTPEHHEHRELTAAGAGKVTVELPGGALDVKTHAEPTFVFDSTVRAQQGLSTDVADQLEIVSDVVEGNATIRMKWKDGFHAINVNMDGHATLLIPTDCGIDAKTGGGDISATGINGATAMNTGGGKVTLDHVHGSIKAGTGGGDIHVQTAVGDVDAHTGGGSISMNEITGDVSAHTGGGDIKLQSVAGIVNGDVGGGSIHASIVKQIDKPMTLSTGGGDIRLTLPADLKANLSATAGGGNVTCELMMQGTMNEHGFHGKVNGGGPEVRLKTGGGSIKVLAASK